MHIDGPGWKIAVFNAVEKLLGEIVGVGRCHSGSFIVAHGLVSLVGLDVDLDVCEAAIRFCELVRVPGVAVHALV